MDEPSRLGGSVRRARERAEAGIPRGRPPSIPSGPPRRLQAPPGFQGMAISRPSPVPQWPLPGPLASPASVDSEPYKPPPGKSQPPQRPPRPSQVPSILDGSRIQDHTPVFQYAPQNSRISEVSAPETAMTSSSRPSTLSSVGSIPDFPLPVATPVAPSRRSVNLGPPPSSRRGASSFYSTASFVSPIPEESPRSRSYASYASSAAIPESFGTISPGNSPNDVYFDDTIAEESMSDADADESRLVRNASIGKRGKPSLVTTKSSEKSDQTLRPSPQPTQGGPFEEGTGYVENSSSSEGVPSTKDGAPVGVTAANMLNAFDGASAMDPSAMRKATPSPRPFRLSGLRRPPRLDIDAVRAAEARGSLTSLPDLIRRATRLATMIDRGRRPASRFDDLDFPEELYARDLEKDTPYDPEKHQSGLSDMLAAFPPPASRRSMRQSGNSWPLPANGQTFRAVPAGDRQQAEPEEQKKKRRCCGLPLSAFLIIVFLLLCIVAAAIVVPLELLVLNKPGEEATPEPATSDCPTQLICQNGGTNVITQGVCSCICSNGFTGSDCTIPTSQGCTTTTIDQGESIINNVTIGQAIPRLIQAGQANFSIPLSATVIMSKFNSANLSCVSENALVTFDGQSSESLSNLNAANDSEGVNAGLARVAAAEPAVTLTVSPDADATIIVKEPEGSGSVEVTTLTAPTTFSGSTLFATTLTFTKPDETTASSEPTKTSQTASQTITLSSRTTTTSAEPTATFAVTQEVVDFARIAVLYVLQQQTIDDASTAQTTLQAFFNDANSSMQVMQATNFTIGGSNTIDLVNFFVDAGDGRQGGRSG
ncbi:hypothetical protein F4809DRAFT_647514 [Biscogniauxia mediterranea]|nr:hypothetical protein F4809DRAFT_647514 [Biscogniauxia mediterranea]